LKWVVDPVADVVTTAGDLIYGTAADTVARLGIGTAGQVLQVNSGATAPEWAAPAAGGALKFISRSSFSNVANTGTTFDTVFSATYKTYLVVIENISAATTSNSLHFQFRNGSSTLATTYNSAWFGLAYTSATPITINVNNGSEITLTDDLSAGTALSLYVSGVGGTTTTSGIYGTGIDRFPITFTVAGGYFGSSVNIDGFILKSSSTNITGTLAIYGLATS